MKYKIYWDDCEEGTNGSYETAKLTEARKYITNLKNNSTPAIAVYEDGKLLVKMVQVWQSYDYRQKFELVTHTDFRSYYENWH